jgi:hypothetical protein
MEFKKNKFWDFFSNHCKTESDHHRFSPLDKINEVSEWSSVDNKSEKKVIPIKKEYMKRHLRAFSESPKLSDDPSTAFFQRFLLKLQKHWQIYEILINQSFSKKVLIQSECRGSLYYYKHIHYLNHDKFFKKPKNPKNFDDYGLETSQDFENFETIENFISTEDTFVYPSSTRARIAEFYNSMRISNEPAEITEAPRAKRKKTKIKAKKTILQRNNPKLIKIYQEMCGNTNSALKSCRLTNFLFRQFLGKRFEGMTEVIGKYFDFKSANFEDFCTEIDRILSSNDEKFLSLCFDAFDFNRDKYICYQDTYSAIQARHEDLYDSDLVKLNTMLEMKKKGILPLKRVMSKRARRPSVMSLTSEISAFDEAFRPKDIAPVHPSKPEAITFDDFTRIEFKGKPQLICSLFQYICNFDINTWQDIQSPVFATRRNSEEMVFDLSYSLITEGEQFNYFKDLEEKIRLFSYSRVKDLMEKFELLRDKNVLNERVITKSSMIENWGKLFGYFNEYISERFYFFFTDQKNKNINKSMFLQKISDFENDENQWKKTGFEFYDSRCDKKLTSDEVYRMEQSLPEGSAVHKECTM